MLLFCSSTTALGNVLLGDLLPKFFATMVLHLLDFLPCQPQRLTEGLSNSYNVQKDHATSEIGVAWFSF